MSMAGGAPTSEYDLAAFDVERSGRHSKPGGGRPLREAMRYCFTSSE